jgi:hypothetical protein
MYLLTIAKSPLLLVAMFGIPFSEWNVLLAKFLLCSTSRRWDIYCLRDFLPHEQLHYSNEVFDLAGQPGHFQQH